MDQFFPTFAKKWCDENPIKRDVAIGAAVAGATVCALPFGLAALGFGSAGVAAGSVAAGVQGATVASGSLYDVHQFLKYGKYLSIK
jgi:hypothetical protein